MKMNLKIRKAKVSDARAICALVRETVDKINSKDCSIKQINAWKRHYSERIVSQKIKSKDFYCLIKNNEIVGTCFLDGDFLGGMYVSAENIGKGYGKKLIKFIEDFAREKNIKKLELFSTKMAVKFYKKAGYKLIGPVHPLMFGVKFNEFKMEKTL